MSSFYNKNILIVGASSGIGAKTAIVLSKKGASVILVARREDKLAELSNSIGTNAHYYVSDVSIISNIGDLVKRIVNDNGKIDGFVYAAGFTDDVPLRFLDYDRILKIFNTNYFPFVELMRHVSQKSNYNKGMRVVAISSISSIIGEKAHTSYSASKAAIDATIRCLSKELYDRGIVLNTVQPGMIRTDMYNEFILKMGSDGSANELLKKTQYAGIGEAEDVANVISFLLSNEARFITGVSVPIDGGASST